MVNIIAVHLQIRVVPDRRITLLRASDDKLSRPDEIITDIFVPDARSYCRLERLQGSIGTPVLRRFSLHAFEMEAVSRRRIRTLVRKIQPMLPVAKVRRASLIV